MECCNTVRTTHGIYTWWQYQDQSSAVVSFCVLDYKVLTTTKPQETTIYVVVEVFFFIEKLTIGHDNTTLHV